MAIRYGTSHFVSLSDAIDYYSKLGYNGIDVGHKLHEGEISIGPPSVPDGCSLIIDRKEGRYFILDPT